MIILRFAVLYWACGGLTHAEKPVFSTHRHAIRHRRETPHTTPHHTAYHTIKPCGRRHARVRRFGRPTLFLLVVRQQATRWSRGDLMARVRPAVLEYFRLNFGGPVLQVTTLPSSTPYASG